MVQQPGPGSHRSPAGAPRHAFGSGYERQRVALAVIVLKLTVLETAGGRSPRPLDLGRRGDCALAGRGATSLFGLCSRQEGNRATESSVSLAKASALGTKANRADLEAIVTRTLDSVSFNAWLAPFTAGNVKAEQLAEKRLRPEYRPAFYAWLATDPAHNPNAPPGLA